MNKVVSGFDDVKSEEIGPAIILIDPQLGNNIGAAARAMLNCGLKDLRLVRPRDGWPNTAAVKMASGATEVLNNTKVFGSTLEAVSDLNLVLATTARMRDLSKTVLSPKQAADWVIDHHANAGRSGILFGPERSGLVNDDIVMADAVINVPLNPDFSSLNLAQAVLLVGYEWFQNGIKPKILDQETGRAMAAKVSEREYFYERLESELDKSGFLYPDHLAPTIKKNLRSMFNRTGLTQQEVRTLHGILTALTNPKN